MIDRKSADWFRLGFLFLLLTGFALRLYELTLQDIWWDEARNIDVSLRAFIQIPTAPELDIHPPIYFWLLHGWGRIAGLTQNLPPIQIAYLSRFLSVGAGLIGVALLYPLARQLTSRQAAFIAILIGTLSPFWLAESQEARMYTVGFALLTGAAVAFCSIINTEDDTEIDTDAKGQCSNRKAQVSFILLSALSLLTHYNAVFILVAWYGWWTIWALCQYNRWQQLRQILLCGLSMTVLVLPITPIALRQIPTYANPNLTVPTIGEYLQQNWQSYIGGYAFDPLSLAGFGYYWLWIALGLGVIGLLLSLTPPQHTASDWYSHTPAENKDSQFTTHCSKFTIPSSFLLVWLLAALALYYIAVLDRGAFNPRYSSFVTPPLYLLLGMAVMGWAKLWRWLPPLIGIVIIVGMVPAIYADIYSPRFAREDISGMTQWLRERAGPNDLILVDQKYPFGFYYQPYRIEAEIEFEEEVQVASARYLFVDINTVDQQLSEWAGNANQIFWVQWFESDTDPRRSVPFLLDKAGQRAGKQRFQGYLVDWWQLSPPNQFELVSQMAPATFIFPPAVEVVEASWPQTLTLSDTFIPIVLRWKRVTEGYLDRPLKARLALYDQAGSRLSQDDRPILNDRHLMPSEWSRADTPLNVYKVKLPSELQIGAYSLKLLVYDAGSLEPLTIVDIAGNPAGIEALVGTIEIVND